MGDNTEMDAVVWTGFIWLRIEISGGLSYMNSIMTSVLRNVGKLLSS
jgi:hypothetical protein